MNPCFCIGCGSSINDIDLSLLDKYPTIGTNYIIEKYPNVKMSIFLDRIFWDENSEIIKQYKGQIYCHERAIPQDCILPNMTIFKTRMNYPEFEEKDPLILMGRLSGFTALNLAMMKGYDPIYLIGYDMYSGHLVTDSMKGRLDDDTINHIVTQYGSPDMAKHISFFDFYAKLPVKIINLNPYSAIRCFPFQTFDSLAL